MRNITSRAAALLFALILALTPCLASAETSQQNDAGQSQKITIVFSHDMHSHLEKFAKIKTLIDKAKSENDATFVLDGGDFSMGTPYQTIFKKEAAEIRMMGYVGYDVTTLGNHEFDYRSKGLTAMLNRAVSSGDKLPQIVIANIDWKSTLADSKLKADGLKLQAALKNYGVKDYTVIKRGGVKIAVFGIFGKESASYAPESGTNFSDPVTRAKEVVAEIKKNEDPDLIICVSHSGTNQSDPKKSEDEILAQSVDGIDMIVSGHSHTVFAKPLKENGTIIASCGQYNDNLGEVTFTKSGSGYKYSSYKLTALGDNVVSDKATAEKVAGFKKLVNKEYFSEFGYTWNQVLAKTDFDFTDIGSFGLKQGEDILGNLISDSYIYGVQKAEGKNYKTVDVAVVPAGVVRGSFSKGDITVEDAYNALSIGTGADGRAGYPLVSIYLTGKELKTAAEVDISVSELMQPARLYMSGLSYKYNPHRAILNRSYDVKLVTANGDVKELQDDKLYRVVADLYSSQMLGVVTSMSKGILSIVPKDENGKAISDYEKYIVHMQDGSELKEWYALASYIDSFSGNKVPAYYSKTEGRKVLVNSMNIIEILKQPSRYLWMLIGVLAAAVLILVLIIVIIVKLVKKHKKKKLRKKISS
jgi:5''-nucleotidase/2'',3''-cyclic phosphodiesterase and related esterases